MHRNIQVLGWTLIWSGILIFGYVGWQIFGTDYLNSRVQGQAQEDISAYFTEERAEPPSIVEVTPDQPLDGSTGPLQFHQEDDPVGHEGFAVMDIPRLEVEVVVFEGVERSTLTKGPGHMPGTPLPGQPGNAVISGHRTTHGRPFHDFDRLEPGDVIEIETAIGTHVYEVRESFIVKPTDVWVTDDKEGGWLTLTTCNPKYSARERLIVTAELVSGPNLDYIDYLNRV